MPEQDISGNKAFLIDKIIRNYSGIFDNLTAGRVAMIRRDKVTRPVIFIGTGTCGIISGASATLIRVKNYISDNNLSADIIEVGCNGYCSAEPVLDVQLPGKARISFRNVTDDKAADVLDAVFHHSLQPGQALGQYLSLIHI